jgi:hypothetical protein
MGIYNIQHPKKGRTKGNKKETRNLNQSIPSKKSSSSNPPKRKENEHIPIIPIPILILTISYVRSAQCNPAILSAYRPPAP